jgi:hypothetical protein
VSKTRKKRPLGRPRCRWKDNIKMNVRQGCSGMDWIHLAQDGNHWRALVNAVMTLKIPYKYWEILE